MFLSTAQFSAVLENTPLVSIDLIVESKQAEVLLGERVNRPAQGNWFVPGGRILKNESLTDAFKRLTKEELGQIFSIDDAVLQGPYDHFYSDSVFGNAPSTHYIAIAYRLKIDKLTSLPAKQHSKYRWFRVEELMSDEKVHEHTKAYFR